MMHCEMLLAVIARDMAERRMAESREEETRFWEREIIWKGEFMNKIQRTPAMDTPRKYKLDS